MKYAKTLLSGLPTQMFHSNYQSYQKEKKLKINFADAEIDSNVQMLSELFVGVRRVILHVNNLKLFEQRFCFNYYYSIF